MNSNEYFVKGCDKLDGCMNILNWYRNLYYQAEPDTERGIMARAINETFMKLKELDVLNKLTKED